MAMPYQPDMVDILNPRVWTGVVRETPVPADYIFQQFLPFRDVPGDRLEWDILTAENPMAPFVAVDAESPRMDDELIRRAWADIVYIRLKRSLKESDVRIIRELGGAPPTSQAGQMAQAARAKIAREGVRLSNAVDARVEWLRVRALLGSIVVNADSGFGSQVRFTITVPVVTRTAATLWTDTANSDPIGDMETWFKDFPFDFAHMIASREVFFNLSRNQKLLRQMFAGVGGGTDPTRVSVQQVMRLISDELGLEGHRYDAKYTERGDTGSAVTITAAPFLPPNKVIFLPREAVGYFATAPAPQNNYQTGKFAWMDESGRTLPMDPYRIELGVGIYGLPVIEQPGKVLVATVA
jgi:hypothetical protein